jgi:excisionase family DNA binding protein
MSRSAAKRKLGPNRPATIATAAKYAGENAGDSVSVRTIYRRIADGSLPAWKFGPRLVRVDLDDVDRLFRPVAAAGAPDAA